MAYFPIGFVERKMLTFSWHIIVEANLKEKSFIENCTFLHNVDLKLKKLILTPPLKFK